MKNIFLSSCILILFGNLSAQVVSTEDIDHFWEAYDHLPNCTSKTDSIAAFQTLYIDRATEGFKAFLAVRDFTALEYYHCIRSYPKFWLSIRPNTLRVATLEGELDKIYAAYAAAFPGHEPPNICFAIGTLRTGGTTANGYLLIGSEIAAADGTTDKSELGEWLNGALPNAFEVRDMIAHEYVHELQSQSLVMVWSYLNHRLLTISLIEGAADFIALQVTGGSINAHLRTYGDAHEEELWNQFSDEMYKNKLDNWLYQGKDTPTGVPADLGYYMGYKICEAYYEQAEDKAQALRDIVEMKHFRRFLRRSGYMVARR